MEELAIFPKVNIYQKSAEYSVACNGDECRSGVWDCKPHLIFKNSGDAKKKKKIGVIPRSLLRLG